MPNWASGSCRIRGKADDLLRFFREGINAYDYDWDKAENTLVPMEDWYTEKKVNDYIECCSSKWAYLEGSRRAFLEEFCADILTTDDDKQVVDVPISQAWTVDSEDWQKVSEQFHVDLWIKADEPNMAFSQEIKIVNGKIKIDRTDDYDDWDE